MHLNAAKASDEFMTQNTLYTMVQLELPNTGYPGSAIGHKDDLLNIITVRWHEISVKPRLNNDDGASCAASWSGRRSLLWFAPCEIESVIAKCRVPIRKCIRAGRRLLKMRPCLRLVNYLCLPCVTGALEQRDAASIGAVSGGESKHKESSGSQTFQVRL